MANRIHNILTFYNLKHNGPDMLRHIVEGYTEGFNMCVSETGKSARIGFVTLNAPTTDDVDMIAKVFPGARIEYDWYEEMPLWMYERVYENGECVREDKFEVMR